MYNRICPSCGKDILYKSKYNKNTAEKLNKTCPSCVTINQHKNVNRKKKININNDTFKTEEYKNKVKHVGDTNGMFGKSFYDKWLSKYGKDIADKKLIEFKAKQVFNNTGSKNSMYGKPSPTGSGNGWSGWYNSWFFRSLLELSYFINHIEKNNLQYECGEQQKYKIQYNTINGLRNYFPDFIIGNEMIEIKPKKLWNSENVIAKKIAAEKWCNENNKIYKLHEPIKINNEILIELYKSGKIKFTNKYEEKIKAWM